MADLTVQSLLNTAVYDSYTSITLTTKTVAQLKADIQTATGVDTNWFDLVLNETVLVEGNTLSAEGVQDGDALRTHNKIARLADRETKQKAKLALAALDRIASGKSGEYDITELPTQYRGDVAVDNPNTGGLLEGRPWSTSGVEETNLVMYLDGLITSSGTTIYDQSPLGNNATLVGPTHDSSNGYFTFDGSNDYIRSPDFNGTAIYSPDTFSAGVWVYPTAAGVVVSITDANSPAGASYHYSSLEMIDSGGNPVPYFGLWNGTGITSDSGTALSYNTWYHMVITYNGTTLKGYINGSEVSSASVTYDSPADDPTGAQYFLFGASDITNMGDGTYFNGRMGEIRLYSSALSPTEVADNYNFTKSRYGY